MAKEVPFLVAQNALDCRQFDKVKAIITPLAERGHPRAERWMGDLYRDGHGVNQDDKAAQAWYLLSYNHSLAGASHGSISAQIALGLCYRDGIGVEINHTRAFHWFDLVSTRIVNTKKSREQRDLHEAVYLLGQCFLTGSGTVCDEREAARLFCVAGTGPYGDAMAQISLGQCYELGIGRVKREKQAFQWYSKAAEQGYIYAMHHLATCWERGFGVVKNPFRAYWEYRKVAELGYPPAMYAVGRFYNDGTGMEKKDYIQAIYWYKQAAKLDYPQAFCALGMCYKQGLGVVVNDVTANHYFAEAMARNHVCERTMCYSANCAIM